MAEDLVNVRLSAKASVVVDQIMESNVFEDKVDVCRFAMAYALRYHFDEINIEEIEASSDNNGLNYNIGTIDGDKSLSIIIQSLYPEVKTPYRYARALIIFGLDCLDELLQNGSLYPINQYL